MPNDDIDDDTTETFDIVDLADYRRRKLLEKHEDDYYESEFNLEEYGINLAKENDKILVDTIKWNGEAKKSGIEVGDYITEFKIQNSNRPNKNIVYPFAFLILLIFGFLNKRKTN